MYRLWTKLSRLLRRLILFIVCFAGLTLILGPEWPAFQDSADKIRGIVATNEFDFLTYELEVLALKGEAALVEGDGQLDEASRKAIVLEFVSLIGEIRTLEREITLIYTDPEIADPDAASSDLQADTGQQAQQCRSPATHR